MQPRQERCDAVHTLERTLSCPQYYFVRIIPSFFNVCDPGMYCSNISRAPTLRLRYCSCDAYHVASKYSSFHHFTLRRRGRPPIQDSLTNSAETVTLAVQGQAGVVLAGSTLIFPSTDDGSSNSDRHGDAEEKQPRQKLRFQGLKPTGRYFASLCTESNSGILSKVVAIGVETHAEAPLVRPRLFGRYLGQAHYSRFSDARTITAWACLVNRHMWGRMLSKGRHPKFCDLCCIFSILFVSSIVGTTCGQECLSSSKYPTFMKPRYRVLWPKS